MKGVVSNHVKGNKCRGALNNGRRTTDYRTICYSGEMTSLGIRHGNDRNDKTHQMARKKEKKTGKQLQKRMKSYVRIARGLGGVGETG